MIFEDMAKQMTILSIKKLFYESRDNKTAFNTALKKSKINTIDIPKLNVEKLDIFYYSFIREILKIRNEIKRKSDEEKILNRKKFGSW
jgi:hypothetical protein